MDELVGNDIVHQPRDDLHHPPVDPDVPGGVAGPPALPRLADEDLRSRDPQALRPATNSRRQVEGRAAAVPGHQGRPDIRMRECPDDQPSRVDGHGWPGLLLDLYAQPELPPEVPERLAAHELPL